MTITINDRMLLRVVAGPQAGGRRGVQDPGKADMYLVRDTDSPIIQNTDSPIIRSL